MPSPQSAAAVLDRHYLELRHRLLDLAAALDRIDRAGDRSPVADDPRLVRINKALAILGDPAHGRAERLQLLFSLPYDPHWR